MSAIVSFESVANLFYLNLTFCLFLKIGSTEELKLELRDFETKVDNVEHTLQQVLPTICVLIMIYIPANI